MAERSIATVITAMVLAACADDPLPPDPSTIASATAPCRAHCERTLACDDPAVDVDACTMTCAMEAEGWVRQDALAAIYGCEKPLACDDTAGEKACGGGVQPLPIHRAWETACRMKLPACGIGPGDLESFCSVDPPAANESNDNGVVRLFAEVVVDEMLACLDGLDCTARLNCLDDVYTRYHIE